MNTFDSIHLAPKTFQAPSPTAQPEIHLDALQSLRGIAALVVLLRHTAICYPPANPTALALVNILCNSHAAVVVFFVLSGFVLALSLNKAPLSTSSLISFYIKRVFRILPLLIVVTLATLLYTRLPLSAQTPTPQNTFLMGLMPHGLTVSHATFLKCLLGMASFYVPQNWTLMVELIIAILFPFLCAAMKNSSLPVNAAIVLALTVLSFLASGGGKSLPILYATDFSIGIATFLIWRKTTRRPNLAMTLAATALLLTSTSLWSLATNAPAPFHSPAISLIQALTAAIVVLALSDHSRASRLLSIKPLVILGDLSFGLYLIHFLVIVILARLLTPLFTHSPTLPASPIMVLATTATSLVLAAILYKTIEMPFNTFGRHLAKRVTTLLFPSKATPR